MIIQAKIIKFIIKSERSNEELLLLKKSGFQNETDDFLGKVLKEKGKIL